MIVINNEIEDKPQALQPHKYPWWVILFMLIISLTILYSIILLPKYITAARRMQAADIAFINADYKYATELCEEIVGILPSARKAHIKGAEAIFANPEITNKDAALNLLENIVLKAEDWNKITKVMPLEYQQYFETEKR